jgi:hypothetical protein
MQYIVPWHHKLYRWSCNFLLVQLFINLITWPLFLGWGLPITPLSIIGNLVFSPFLTAFLMISSLMVTCDLLALPTWLFAWALEWITTTWLWLMACPTPSCMMTFVTPPLFVALCAPVGATYIIISKKCKTPGLKVMALLGLYCMLMMLFMLGTQPNRIEVPYGSHTVTVVNKHEKLTLIDPGFSRRKASVNQWINYTLLPALGASFGRQTIDQIILKKKSPTAHACAESLRTRGITKKIIVDETIAQTEGSTTEQATGDVRAKTKPSFRAVPSTSSKSPWYRNRSFPQSQESLRASRK